MAEAAPSDPIRDLQLLLRSNHGLIHLDTLEHDRAAVLLRHVADSLGIAYFVWTRTKGLRRADGRAGAAGAPAPGLDEAGGGEAGDRVYGSTSPAAALEHVESSSLPALYHFQDLGDYLEDKVVAGRLADADAALDSVTGAVVVSGALRSVPESLRPRVAAVKLPPPGAAEFRRLLSAIYSDLRTRMNVKVSLTEPELSRLLANLQGLSLMEARKALTKAIIEDGILDARDVEAALHVKKSIVEQEGLLEYTPAEERLSETADLAGLKAWLAKRRETILHPEKAAAFGLPFPKGVLLVGVQGCGKSLCAKAVASEWGLPLLKLDPSSLYNKYVGESEKNFQRAMRTAERVAPVVLWIDEIEKAFSQGGSDEDGGVSQRILGTFLGWLQDRKGDVFVVATANDISRLPPEFIRKGRFDEIFFVDLPDAATRADLFKIHLAKRGQDLARFDLSALAAATEGFSGAEIESVVVSALYTAFAAKRPLAPVHILTEVRTTCPLSRTMKEKVDALREWSRTRTVSAN